VRKYFCSWYAISEALMNIFVLRTTRSKIICMSVTYLYSYYTMPLVTGSQSKSVSRFPLVSSWWWVLIGWDSALFPQNIQICIIWFSGWKRWRLLRVREECSYSHAKASFFSITNICDLCQKNRDDASLHKQIEHFTSFNLVPGSSVLDNYFKNYVIFESSCLRPLLERK
jgi:hypothetical protein